MSSLSRGRESVTQRTWQTRHGRQNATRRLFAGGSISSNSLWRHAAIGLVAAAIVVITAQRVPPVFRGAPRPGQALLGARSPRDVPAIAALIETPVVEAWSETSTEKAVTSTEFLRDRSAFALDLMGTGKVGLSRALALADIAVREAYRRQMPPALVLGVMLTENDELKSTARSRQGAIGLMQIHPGPWRASLGPLFGRNLRNDTTNLRYGIFILSHLVRRVAAKAPSDTSTHWRMALLRYNGCVRGRNTRECRRYPDVVREEVQRSARTICAGLDFDRCVVTPLRLGVRKRAEAD